MAFVFHPLFIILGPINLLVGLAAAIWLAVLGQWSILGYGILALIASSVVLTIATLPEPLFAGPAAYFREKRIMFLFYVFHGLTGLFINAVLTVWCMAVLVIFTDRAHPSTLAPILLWSYAIATSYMGYMARKSESGPAFLSVFFAKVAYIVLMATILIVDPSVGFGFALFAAIMLLAVVFQLQLTVAATRSTTKRQAPLAEDG